MYVRDGNRLIVCATQPERKRWWRNLRRDAPVGVRLRGREYRTHAHVLTHRIDVERALGLYLAGFPNAAKSLGVPPDANGRPTPSARRRREARAVIVVIEPLSEERS